MPIFSLETGLVVRRGARTLEFLRMLDGGKVQFEDQLTRHVQTMKLARFYADVLDGKLLPVLYGEEQAVATDGVVQAPTVVMDISSIPPTERETILRRMAYVKALRKRGISRGQRDQVAMALPAIASAMGDPRPPSASSVMTWARSWEDSSMNPMALRSKNACRKRERLIHPLVEEIITKKLKSVYLTRERHTLRHAHEQMLLTAKKLQVAGKLTAAEAQISPATVSRRLKEFPCYDVERARFTTNRARASYRTTVEGSTAVRPMQRLECDHTLLNWVVLDDRTGLPLGRPTLTIVVDGFSGYVVGLYVSFYGPGLTSVLNVLKNAIRPKEDLVAAAGAEQPWLAFGIGECIVLDNGLEFHSGQFKLAAAELGMDIEYCRVRTPWLKPKVERFFANLDHFSLAWGRVRKPLDHVQNLDPKKDAAILFSDFVKGLIRFVVDIYPFELNSRRLHTSFEIFKEGIGLLPPPAFPSSFQQLDMIAAMSKMITVAQGGVDMVGLTYSSNELLDVKKDVGAKFRTFVKWNPDDLSQVFMQHPLTKGWLTIPSIRVDYTGGLSWIQHRLIRQHARQQYIEGGTYERLLRARQELYEMWMNPIARRNRAQDVRILAKLTGLSSDHIVLGPDVARPIEVATRVVSKEEVEAFEGDVPDFDSFLMARA